MKTFLKIVAAIIGLLIIVGIGLNLYFTDERLKNTVLPILNDAIGRTVEAESMSLTLFSTFPQPGISIEKMRVPGKTNSDTLLALDELVASVELFSLMGDQINISEIQLRNPSFTYVVNADSSTNIDFLTQGEDTSKDTTGGYAINIPYFYLTGGDFGYRDATSNTTVKLRDLNADISLRYADEITSSINMELGGLSASVGGTSYLSNLPLSLSQRSTIDLNNETISLDQGTFSIRGLALSLSGSVSNWSQSTDIDLQFNSSSDNFGELLRLIPAEYAEYTRNLETKGTLSIEGSIQGAAGGESLPDFALNIGITDGYLKNPDLPQPIQNIQLTASASNNLLTIEKFTAQASENNLSAQGKLENPLEENGTLSLTFDGNIDLATIKEFYPINEDTLSMRGMLTANATLQGTIDQIEQAVQQGNIRLNNGYISHKSLGEPIENITLESTINGPTISIGNASFTTGNNTLNAKGDITNYLNESRSVDLKLTGKATLNQITNYYDLAPAVTALSGQADLNLAASGPISDPANMRFNGQLTVQDMNMEGEAVTQPVNNLNGELNLSPSSATLRSLSFNIGSSDIALEGSLQNYMAYLKAQEDRKTTPHLKGSFQSKFLNLDELINWEDTTSAPTPIHLPDLTSTVTANISEMTVTGVTMTDLTGRATTTPKQINLERARVSLFGGKATGAFTWDVPQPDHTTISFQGTLDSLQAESFFAEYPVLGEKSKFHEYISGAFSAKIDYYSELNGYLEPMIGTSKMDGNFGMTKSRLQGHPLQDKLASFLSTKEFRNLALDEWESTYTLEDSIFTLKNLRLTSGNIGAELNGTQHLVKGDIDYQTKLLLPSRFKSAIASVITKQAANALTQGNGTIMVPLRITGTHANPKIAPDKKVIAPIVKDYLKDKAGNVLKKLFDG